MKRRDFLTGAALTASTALIPANAELKPAEFIAPDKFSAWCAGCGRKIVRLDADWVHEEMQVKSSYGTAIEPWVEFNAGFMPKRKARRGVLRHGTPPTFELMPRSALCKKPDGSNHGIFVLIA